MIEILLWPQQIAVHIANDAQQHHQQQQHKHIRQHADQETSRLHIPRFNSFCARLLKMRDSVCRALALLHSQHYFHMQVRKGN